MSNEHNSPIVEDPEIAAMVAVIASLKGLDAPAQIRVLDYVLTRLGLTLIKKQSAIDTRERHGDVEPVEPAPQETRGGVEESDKGRGAEVDDNDPDGLEGISPIARKWMKRNDLSSKRISQLYSLGVDEIDLVARKAPGKSARERLRQVMLLQGIASYLNGGVPKIDNEKLKEAISHYDADVGGNFATYAKEWAADIAGSRAAGDLTLTTRGLNAAKDLINQMTVTSSKGE
jgi:hypothetical protein